MLLSIIIPTLNEEKFLPKLLESIKKQTFKDYEIIVADAGSSDNTLEIAKKFGCRIVKGGIPAVGRNKGALAARGEVLLFLDADVILPNKYFLDKALKEFKRRNLLVASCGFLPADKSIYLPATLVKNYFKFIRKLMIHLENIFPFGIGACIMADKEFHNKIGGFANSIKLAEDNNYIKKASKVGRYGVLRDVYILISVRRFDKEKWVRPFLLYASAAFFVGDEKKLQIFNSGILNYKYTGYYDIIKKSTPKIEIERMIQKIKKKISDKQDQSKEEMERLKKVKSDIKRKMKKIIEKVLKQ